MRLDLVFLVGRTTSGGVFWGVCHRIMILGSLSANGWGCVPVLLGFCSLLVIEWSWVLVLRWRSLGELLPFDITWSREVSGGPMSWAQLSHLRGTGLTPGWSTKTLLATWLLTDHFYSYLKKIIKYGEIFMHRGFLQCYLGSVGGQEEWGALRKRRRWQRRGCPGLRLLQLQPLHEEALVCVYIL